MRFLLTLIAFASLGGQAYALNDGWECTNADFEISCTEAECEIAESHTPMSVFVNDSKMKVCAYSGCWEDQHDSVTRSGPFRTYIANSVPWSSPEEGSSYISITIDTAGGVGTIIVSTPGGGGGYAQPLTCESV